MAWQSDAEKEKQRRIKIMASIFPDLPRAGDMKYSPEIDARGAENDRLTAIWIEKERQTWYKATDGMFVYLMKNPCLNGFSRVKHPCGKFVETFPPPEKHRVAQVLGDSRDGMKFNILNDRLISSIGTRLYPSGSEVEIHQASYSEVF